MVSFHRGDGGNEIYVQKKYFVHVRSSLFKLNYSITTELIE